MRSIRTMLLLALAAMTAMALVAPGLASAANWKQGGKELQGGLTWTENGGTLAGEGGSLSLAGNFKLNGPVGIVDCPVNAAVSLDPLSASGELDEFQVEAVNCELGGFIGSVCTEVASVVSEGPASVGVTGPAGSPTIAIDDLKLNYTFKGGLCTEEPEVWYETNSVYYGPLIATPNNPKAIGSVSWSGKMVDVTGGVNSISGTMAASPAGKYGIAPNGTIAVSGTIGWENSFGSMSCPISGTGTLEPGKSEGKLSVQQAGNCQWGGWIASCGIKSVSFNQPWTIIDQGSYASVKGISIGVYENGCGLPVPFSGELKATPDKTTAISYTTLTGKLDSGGMEVSWSGQLNWTPAGAYGL
jgi:hypothetical protein